MFGVVTCASTSRPYLCHRDAPRRTHRQTQFPDGHSDFWHLDLHYDRDDHGCDDLFLSGEQFLEWWTTHTDEVNHAFAAQPS